MKNVACHPKNSIAILRLRHEEYRVLSIGPPVPECSIDSEPRPPDEHMITPVRPPEVLELRDQAGEQLIRLGFGEGFQVQMTGRVLGHEEEVRLLGVVRTTIAAEEPVVQLDLLMLSQGLMSAGGFLSGHVVRENLVFSGGGRIGMDCVEFNFCCCVTQGTGKCHANERGLYPLCVTQHQEMILLEKTFLYTLHKPTRMCSQKHKARPPPKTAHLKPPLIVLAERGALRQGLELRIVLHIIHVDLERVCDCFVCHWIDQIIRHRRE